MTFTYPQESKEYKIIKEIDEIIITDKYGYTFIRITNPDDENIHAKEIAEKIIPILQSYKE